MKKKDRAAAAAEGRETTDSQGQPDSPDKEGESYIKIVMAVAQIIKLLIKEAVAEAMQSTSEKIGEELKIQVTRSGGIREKANDSRGGNTGTEK